MSPLVSALAKVNRELANAYREGDLSRIKDLSEAQVALMDLIGPPDALIEVVVSA